MFQCLHSSCSEDQTRPCENTHCTTVSSSDHVSIPKIFVVIVLLPPALVFAFAPVLWRVGSSQLVFHFYLYSTVSATCHKSCMNKYCTFITLVLITQNTTVTCQLYFPYALNTDIGNQVKLIKLSSVPMFVFPKLSATISAALTDLVCRFNNHTAMCYQ